MIPAFAGAVEWIASDCLRGSGGRLAEGVILSERIAWKALSGLSLFLYLNEKTVEISVGFSVLDCMGWRLFMDRQVSIWLWSSFL